MKKPYFPKLEIDQTQVFFKIIPDILNELEINTDLKHFIDQNIENYYPWEKFSNLKLPSTKFTAEELWGFIKIVYRPRSKKTQLITDKSGHPFWYSHADRISQSLHKIDKMFSGNPILFDYDIEENYKDEWAKKRIITSLFEEAINSSQIEGAAISRRKAKELIRSGHRPNTKDEIMVMNNYQTIRRIKSEFIAKPATKELILEIHSALTKDTIDPRDVGRFREDIDENDKVNVYDDDGITILHEPPAAATLDSRIKDFCCFINNNEPFIHPVIKGIIIHFAIGYIHPFYDGNGRVARGLFYWFLLKNGYRLFEFISISEQIKKSIGQYKKAYLYTELDDNDLTYFIYYHLTVIEKCLTSLTEYIHTKLDELKNLKKALRNIPGINTRQIDLLNHALKHIDDVDQRYTIESHKNSNDISWATARADLFKLADRGFLEKRKLGKTLYFYIPKNLTSQISGRE